MNPTINASLILATFAAAIAGVVTLSKTLTVERQQIATVAWVTPYQTACLETKTIKISAWDSTWNRGSHRKVAIDGSNFHFRGSLKDSEDCGNDGFTLNLYRS
jgi:hypothetical protein